MSATVLLRAEGLGFAHPGRPLFHDVGFVVGPGLTLVRGGESRGKTTLLRLIAGQEAPQAGRLLRSAAPVCLERPADPAADDVAAADWIAARRAAYPTWDAAVEAALIEDFDLGAHLRKPMRALSTGSRRKAGLVVAAACGAPLVLLDTPFAALDLPSRRRLAELLADAAGSADRAWVVADHEAPALPGGARWAAVIDLGD